MKLEQLNEILECLSEDRTKFYYFKDRYALMLLSHMARGGTAIREIRKTPYGKLLERPVVREVLRNNGSGVLSAMELDSFWPARYHCYLLTLGRWGSRDSWARFSNQTSRPGWNLVLQLNFSAQHNASYEKLIQPRELAPFQSHGHPTAGEGYQTLAWARIDLDLDNGEALIEEIQTDWIRLATRSREYYSAYVGSGAKKRRYLPRYIKGLGCDLQALCRYIEGTLQPHMDIWQEAMLASSIWFLKEEIGIKMIYYHTYEFCCRLKRIEGTKPPRSLYTRLPTRFCFEKTNKGPTFLFEKNNRKNGNLLKNRDIRQFFFLEF